MEQQGGGGSGWTFLKVVGLVVGILGIMGFSFLALCGFLFQSYDKSLVWIGVAGLVCTGLSAWLMVAMIRMARRDRNRGP